MNITPARKLAAPLALLALFAVGCTTHIAPYRPKHRRFDPGEFGERSKPSDGRWGPSTRNP